MPAREPRSAAVKAAATKEGVELSVEDTGIVIATELPHILERLYRADVSRSGNAGFGLGLSTAQAVTRADNSEIQVWSAPGEGSRFGLRLKGESLSGDFQMGLLRSK